MSAQGPHSDGGATSSVTGSQRFPPEFDLVLIKYHPARSLARRALLLCVDDVFKYKGPRLFVIFEERNCKPRLR